MPRSLARCWKRDRNSGLISSPSAVTVWRSTGMSSALTKRRSDSLNIRSSSGSWNSITQAPPLAPFVLAKAGTQRAQVSLARTQPLSSPRRRRAVRGKSGIAEFQLVCGVVELSSSWIGRRRFVDFCDRPSQEQALANQLGQPQGRHGEAIDAGSDAQQQIGNHGGENLQADCVFIPAQELADAQMLIDPAEPEFDL